MSRKPLRSTAKSKVIASFNARRAAAAKVRRILRIVSLPIRILIYIPILFLKLLLAIAKLPFRWAQRFAARIRYIYSILRAGGFIWLVMQTIRRYRFPPFTVVDGFYYRLCRLRSLGRTRQYSFVSLYSTKGSRNALRNLLLDLSLRRRQDEEFRSKRNLEIVVAGTPDEIGRMFSAATSLGFVTDFHVYATTGRLQSELPYLVPHNRLPKSGKKLPLTDLDRYPASRVQRFFKQARQVDLALPGIANSHMTQPVLQALLRSNYIISVNLPARDRTLEALMDEWGEFFRLARTLKGPQVFMLLNTRQTSQLADANPEGLMMIFASRMGVQFLEGLSLVRQCDGYVGAFDEYGLMTVGSNVTSLLLDSDGAVRDAGGGAGSPRVVETASPQFLYPEPLTPRQLFEEYRAHVFVADRQTVPT